MWGILWQIFKVKVTGTLQTEIVNYLKTGTYFVYAYTLEYCRQWGKGQLKKKLKIMRSIEGQGHSELGNWHVQLYQVLYTYIHEDIVFKETWYMGRLWECGVSSTKVGHSDLYLNLWLTLKELLVALNSTDLRWC